MKHSDLLQRDFHKLRAKMGELGYLERLVELVHDSNANWRDVGHSDPLLEGFQFFHGYRADPLERDYHQQGAK
jgi:hypothetical protein